MSAAGVAARASAPRWRGLATGVRGLAAGVRGLAAAVRGVRGGLRSVPVAAWACALVALANGLAWSLVTPPFQVPDEDAHYAYVQQVAERGTLPRAAFPEGSFSPREDYVLSALLTFGIVGHGENPAPFTEAQQQVLEGIERQHLSTLGSGDALTATSNPPLYYVLEAVPYKLTSGSVLDKLAAMRLLSALMGAATVLLVFMFLRELLPGTPWSWPAGALVVAFQPLFGFLSGGVNNDDLLFLTAAGVLWALARSFRRGLGVGNGALLGGFLGAGLVSKLTIAGFLPGVAVALGLLLVRAPRSERHTAARGAGVALALTLAPVAVYALLDHFVWRRAAIPGGVASSAPHPTRRASLREEISHVWQLFMPRLWLRRQFDYSPLWATWFEGFVGKFGWLDYGFPAWVYQVARVVVLGVIALALAELVRARRLLRARLAELSVYVLLVLGLCVAIGVESYRYTIVHGGVFEQARYLLPLLGLYGAIAAIAVRLGGSRWGPALAGAVVLLAVGHDLYAQAITIARYYS